MTPSKNFIIRGGTLVIERGLIQADVVVRDELIQLIGNAKVDDQTTVIDASGKLIFPGLIDCHVHFREPGLEQKATMQSEATAAIAGGVTTVCEMPNTVPPTTTIAALTDKVRRAETIKGCDIRFFFGVTEPAHLVTLQELWTGESEELKRLKARCCGLKLYLDHSTGHQKIDQSIIEEVFAVCAKLGIQIVAHCEDPNVHRSSGSKTAAGGVENHSVNRPPESELASVKYAIGLAEKTGARLHIAHLSTAGALDEVRSAKKKNISVTCEVAPHHLFLTTDAYGKLGTLGKMNPPLRSHEDQEALWAGITDGTVDCIATDHAPHTLEEKKAEDWMKAPSGVTGVETMLPLLLTVAAGKWPSGGESGIWNLEFGDPCFSWIPDSRFQPLDILRLCFTNPNRIFSLGKKGIVEGAPADMIIVDPEAEWTIHGKNLHYKCGWTPYEGWIVRGKIL